MNGKFVRIHKDTERSKFDCGIPVLNEYFKKHARQNDRLNIANCFVAVSEDEAISYGYYTLSMGSIGKDTLPISLSKRLPNYPIPVIRIGKLGIDKAYQGKGLGGLMLMHIFSNVVSFQKGHGGPAFKFLVVDSKNEDSNRFYLKYGFTLLDENFLVLPVETIVKLMGAKTVIKNNELA